jgi:hypothetical protein
LATQADYRRDLIANAPPFGLSQRKQTRIDALHDDYAQAWLNVRMAMGDHLKKYGLQTVEEGKSLTER